MEGEPKVSQMVVDEHKTAGDEDPYRALKMVNLIVWLVVIFFIVIGLLTMLSGAGFSSGEEYTPNADFSRRLVTPYPIGSPYVNATINSDAVVWIGKHSY